jgi:hypothetical protein
MNWHRKRPAVFSGFTRAVSQLLRSHKGREERFSLGENYERRRGSPRISYARHLPRTMMCGFLHRKSGFGVHQLRNRFSREDLHC